MMLDGKLSLVLPAHNEAENIVQVVERAQEVLGKVVREHEIIIVNDGSKDGTSELIDGLAATYPEVIAVHHVVNRGYGAALTTGFNTASGDHIMFMDSDQQFDIADINNLLPYVPHYDIVAGYRIQRRDPFYRKLFARTFGLAVLLLFQIRMRDLDCAFKIYRADLLKEIELTTPGALINTEMLARAKQRRATIAEVGVNHYPRPAGESSGGSPKVVFRAMGETLKLWWRLRREPKDGIQPLHDLDENAQPAVRPRTVALALLGALLVLVIAALAMRGDD